MVVMSGFFFLGILLLLTLVDYASRGFTVMPPQLQ